LLTHVGLSAIALQSGGDANTNNILEVTETWTYTATYTVIKLISMRENNSSFG
jgi:hypothetical protein